MTTEHFEHLCHVVSGRPFPSRTFSSSSTRRAAPSPSSSFRRNASPLAIAVLQVSPGRQPHPSSHRDACLDNSLLQVWEFQRLRNPNTAAIARLSSSPRDRGKQLRLAASSSPRPCQEAMWKRGSTAFWDLFNSMNEHQRNLQSIYIYTGINKIPFLHILGW